MQGHIESLGKQVKVHSRCILKHANLPTRFLSETTAMSWPCATSCPRTRCASPLVKVGIPSTGEIAYHKEVEIFDDKLPFADPSCMPDRQGFSDKDIEALHKPTNRQATRASPRTPAPSASPALVHAANDDAPVPLLEAQVSAAGDSAADPIQEASDKALATFSSKRKLLLDLGKDAFYEHAWKVKCVDTIFRDGRVYVTSETIAGETPALTTQEQGKRFDMPVSRGKDLRDTNLRRAIELCMPGEHTMQGLLAYCAAPAPYPSFEGETQKNSKRAKEDVVRIKGREFSSDLKIDIIDSPTTARILVSYQKPLEIQEGELVEPIGVRRNKNKTCVECRFISPEQKVKRRMLASIEMSGASKGQRSVRDILNIMHDMPSTLNDICISARTAERCAQQSWPPGKSCYKTGETWARILRCGQGSSNIARPPAATLASGDSPEFIQ
jgi:hypothetical protein